MIDNEAEAYAAAKAAARLHFGAAVRGLVAGHEAALEEMRSALTRKDMSFLMALALTEKGKRLDKGGIMAGKIVDGLRGLSLCEAERKFITAFADSGGHK